jgi:uncharacterized protein YyaL (SSP411 family)
MTDAHAPILQNRLRDETSPYLLQHQDNPVHWQPWSDGTLALAKEAQKPIMLSVGYAACHWCHVMAHECFEDPEIADLMNRLFVNIKVDREERPDIDAIYQTALALLGEHGGWPLTMFLTPDGAPFWGGTYFPPAPRFGRPSFPQVLQGVADIFSREPDKVAKNVSALADGLKQMSQTRAGALVDLETITEITRRLTRQIDPFEGGFGSAPKFPQPTNLKLLWRAWLRSGAEPFRQAVELTLLKMSQGGIYDHLGGGFARYSVDNHWLVPHFEKMLYDNAQLVQVLTWIWQDTKKEIYACRVQETVTWALREMMAAADAEGRPSTAFASSFDADSEGEEGLFYLWHEEEIDRLLGREAALFKQIYGVTPDGNFEGRTILNRSGDLDLSDPATEERLAAARACLFEARRDRVPPGWDDKVLADWNGLMISALAEAALAFGEAAWLAAAEKTFAFVLENMQPDGRLRHSWRRGRAAHPATLDDYAHLCEAAVVLHEVTGETRYLDRVEAWLAVLDRHYWDKEGGGYFFTADDTDDVIVRAKNALDQATPSGNGTLAGVLAKLYFLTGDDRHRERAEATIAAFTGEIERTSSSLATLLAACELLHDPLQIVVIGQRGDADSEALIAAVFGACLPNRVFQIVAPDEPLPEHHPAAGHGQIDGKATAYVCRALACSPPVSEPEPLRALLRPST